MQQITNSTYEEEAGEEGQLKLEMEGQQRHQGGCSPCGVLERFSGGARVEQNCLSEE